MILPDLQNILLFASAAFALIVMPGPAVLYITTKSIDQGYKAGLVSILGIGTGALFHVFAAAFGISALFIASTLAFTILKYVGACYLMYLGIQKFRENINLSQHKSSHKPAQKLLSVFYEGVVVNILNPKVATFFFAFLPVFVSEEKGGLTSQILFLGFLFIIIAVLSDIVYVFVSNKLSGWITNNPDYLKFQKYIIGSIYVLLGLLTLAVSKPSIKK